MGMFGALKGAVSAPVKAAGALGKGALGGGKSASAPSPVSTKQPIGGGSGVMSAANRSISRPISRGRR